MTKFQYLQRKDELAKARVVQQNPGLQPYQMPWTISEIFDFMDWEVHMHQLRAERWNDFWTAIFLAVLIAGGMAFGLMFLIALGQ